MRWLPLGAGMAAIALAAATPWVKTWLARSAGAELYDGRRPLAARIDGHSVALPPHATRCINCHEGSQAIGPTLNDSTLTQDTPRRGGPPSHYDAVALCRLLRDGIDPAFVVLPRAMPRYDIDDADCHTLWLYLTSR